jgi:uncharacterized coiled-coil protein SlyX
MPNSPRPGLTHVGWVQNSRGAAPNSEAQQHADDLQALCNKIASLEAQQKEIIQRFSIQRGSVEELGVALARVEKELAQAKDQLKRAAYRGSMVNPGDL